jgi:signal transduction histidine kinase
VLVGVIYVFRHPSAARFEPRDRELLGLFARQAAAAIEQGRLAAATLAEKSRLEEMQSTFVSIVSHELQTPVAIIKAYAGTLARPDAPWSRETVTRVAHTIEEECDRLHRLITDLLDLSRIQAGRVAMTIGAVDLAELADSVAERNRTRAPGHTIETDFPSDFPTIRGDQEKLRQALANLVDNAIKYSPDGGSIKIAGRGRGDVVVVSVSDTGIGMPREELAHVFDRFHRVDTRLSRATQGVGLGLYICRVIVEAHGGRIWAESPGPGRGSTFWIQLPQAAFPQLAEG